MPSDPRFGIGGNQPPLDEQLVEETAPLKERADELISSARDRAVVQSDEDAEKATLLIAMMREHGAVIEAARAARKAPFLAAGRTVDVHFAAIAVFLEHATAELLTRLNAHRRQKEAAAEAERKRLAEEAERQRRLAEDAEAARLRAEENARTAETAAARETARREKAEAEIERRRAEDHAARAEAQSEAAAAPVVIHSGYGPKAVRRVDRRVEITDLRRALQHCLKIDEHRIREVVAKVYAAQVRAGVRELPGAEIIEDSTTVVRRR